MKPQTAFALFAAVHLLSAPASAGEISVAEWFLATVVDNSVPGGGQIAATVINPFELDHFASVGNSTAQTHFSFAWNSGANFLIESEHAAAGTNGPLVQSRSSGNIWLTPSVESILTLDAVYDYALGSGDRQLDYTVAAFGGGDGIGFTDQIIPFVGDPPVGQFVFHDELLLQPGVEYTLQYVISHLSFSGSADSLSTGSGSVQFSIVPIPEPATATLVALVTLPALCRRRRRQRR